MKQYNRTISILSVLSFSITAGAFASAVDSNPLEAILSSGQEVSAEFQIDRALKNNSALLDSEMSVQVMGAVENEGLTTIKARQLYKGIPVLGSLISIENGNDSSFFGNVESLTLSTKPRVSANQAVAIAQRLSKNPIARAPELAILPSADRANNRLTYWVDVASTDLTPGVEVVIDAVNGNIIAEVPKMHTAAGTAPITVMDAKEDFMVVDPVWATPAPVIPGASLPADPKLLGCYVTDPVTSKTKYMASETECNNFIRDLDPDMRTRCQVVLKDALDSGRAFPVTYDPKRCTFSYMNSSPVGTPSTSGSKAFTNTKLVLEYLRDELGRDSFDGKGKGIISVVNAGFKLANAAWLSDRDMMIYGAGDGVDFGDFTQLVDVAGHEMTHGVVSKTAALSYMDESGALNEAVADFFGKMIAKDGHWLIGKGLYKADPSRGLRSLENPSLYNARFIAADGTRSSKAYPDNISKKFVSYGECNDNNDRCYVHTNSTIPSHAFYLIHKDLGRDKAQKLIYNALLRYMTTLTNFKGAGAAVRKSCTDLYDLATCGLVDTSLKAVGI